MKKVWEPRVEEYTKYVSRMGWRIRSCSRNVSYCFAYIECDLKDDDKDSKHQIWKHAILCDVVVSNNTAIMGW